MSYKQKIIDLFFMPLENSTLDHMVDVGEQADRDIAARDQRIKELEEALEDAILYLSNGLEGDHVGAVDQEVKKWRLLLADRDSN